MDSSPTEQLLSDSQAPCTRLLLASLPAPGWAPAAVARSRREVAAL